jgi:hypothetical protein
VHGAVKKERTRYARYAKATFRKDRRLKIASLLHKYASGRLKEV